MNEESLTLFLTDIVKRKVRYPPSTEESSRQKIWDETFTTLQTARIEQAKSNASPSTSTSIPTAPLNLNAAGSSTPLWVRDNVLSPQECEMLIEFASRNGCEEMPTLFGDTHFEHRCGTKIHLDESTLPELTRLRQRIQQCFKLDDHAAQTQCQISFTPPEHAASNTPSIGLHVDQNNGNAGRYQTILIYLNTVPSSCGGGTAWPCLGTANKEVVEAGDRLLNCGITCTSDACRIDLIDHGQVDVQMVDGTVEACLLTAAATQGLYCAPIQGRAVLFYSVKENGEPDASSFHAGLSVGGSSAKWTLQMFTTFPPDVVDRKEFLKSTMRKTI